MSHTNQQYELQVLVHGKPVSMHPHEGVSYAWGKTGTEFALKVRNNTGHRVEAAVTVDGLSIMNGKLGNYDTGGYLVPSHSSIEVPGWRLNQKRVAQFYFARFGESYAALMGKPHNIGIIGCAIFTEAPLVLPSTPHPHFDWPTHPPFRPPHMYGGSSEGLMRGSSGIGTGFGREEEHRVTEVAFKRASVQPETILSIRYGTKEQLVVWGVPMKEPAQVAVPEPFPAEHGVGCTPPPGWRG